MTEPANLWLKSGEDKRLRAGHLWVFSNEVDVERSPLKSLEPGQDVLILDHGGKPVGRGYVNPHSLICARLVSRDVERPLDQSLITHRINVALSLRERHFAQPYYRLVYGESDGLPGLVIDRFGPLCVVQINTAGMEVQREAIVTALRKTVEPAHILIRADNAIRDLEGLDQYVAWADEEGPDETAVEENGCRFVAPTVTGQKTGWYFDHRANRARLAPYVRGRRVLDVFSYVGAWGVQALQAGADEAMCVDSSEQALDYAQRNAELNGFGDRFAALEGDAFQALQALRQDGERFDVVIVDPPAFIKRRKDHRQGLKAYQQLNQAAMQLLSKDGILVSASCSAHLGETDFQQSILRAARHLDRTLQLVETGRQGPDHPVFPAIPETQYLKAAFARVLPARSVP